MNSILKSILAVVGGILAGAIPTMACDKLLEGTGMMNAEHFAETPLMVILGVLGYRVAFNILGCYVCARLAPRSPMMHCMIIGVLGTLGSIAATLAMPEAGPKWYGFSVAAISIPCAWLGARIAMSPAARSAA